MRKFYFKVTSGSYHISYASNAFYLFAENVNQAFEIISAYISSCKIGTYSIDLIGPTPIAWELSYTKQSIFVRKRVTCVRYNVKRLN